MGARNVSAAFAMWAHLDHAPFRVLVGMALMSLDQASAEGRPARVYFGGEDALVEFLGRSRSAAYKALGALRKAGAVEVMDVGRKGHRAVYKLALDPFAKPHSVAVTETSKGRGNRDGKGRGNRDQRVAVNETPRSTEEGTEESRPGETSPPAVVSPGPDRPVDNPDDDPMTHDDATAQLQRQYGLAEAALRVGEHQIQHGCTWAEASIHTAQASPVLRVIEGGRSA